MSMQLPLAGKIIAVTRPQGQSAELAGLIEQAGGEVLRVPLFEVGALADQTSLHQAWAHLADYSLAIFVSPNAVRFAWICPPNGHDFDKPPKKMKVIPVSLSPDPSPAPQGFPPVTSGRGEVCEPQRDFHGKSLPWPASLTAVAPGPGTARALLAHAVGRVLTPPERHDSEAMLALPELQASRVRGRRVLIFCGEGGRTLLAETMAARGAVVDVVLCYRRLPLATAPARLLQAWRLGRLDALLLTSSESLRYLHCIPEPGIADFLAEIRLFVPHVRIAELARSLGLRHIVCAAADNAGIVASLCAYNWP